MSGQSSSIDEGDGFSPVAARQKRTPAEGCRPVIAVFGKHDQFSSVRANESRELRLNAAEEALKSSEERELDAGIECGEVRLRLDEM